ncbi:alcohol dehydrogenase 1 [Fusarium oxysporum f. sp. lycopersici 4287]|uniref:alcohol dehydrogenase n=2 Tax=Fusarium oxysporum TaxID=5507 RepID=A0A0J9WN05_FUSO4|nr:alcohol dehydrogenase 1 [Fusarium oxysporum f. sp. lycopersici 4287]KNB06442.1 alcohol dehydrogenase 1 [Fusarium oxysporum f. sp. lycopersici 4287]
MVSFNIPIEQWAQVRQRPGGSVIYEKVPVQMPGPDEVLVSVKYSGVCHTNLHTMMAELLPKRKTPLVGGHEGTGVVVAKGELVTDLEVGDHAGIKWLNGSCLTCTFCLQGDEQLCLQPLLSGYNVDGTFQQYAIAKAAHITRIPTGCSLEDVCPILCTGLTVYKGLKESGVRPGQYVAIVGAGSGLGCFALQYAKAMGIHSIAIDTGSGKSQTCTDLGAVAFIDFEKSPDIDGDIRAAVPDGLGPHAIIMLATHEELFEHASKYVRSHGSVVYIGIQDHVHLEAPILDTAVRMVGIGGSNVGNWQDAAEAVELFRLGLIKAPHKLIGLSQLQDVYDLTLKDEFMGRYVVDTSK